MTTAGSTIASPRAAAHPNSAVALMRDTATLYHRSILKMIRMPVQLYFSLVSPLIWFLLFGQVFSRLTTGFGAVDTVAGQNPVTAQFGTDNYSAFFLPAIIIQVMLFGSTNSALGIVNDDQSGYLNKLRVAPINRLSILVGSVLADLTRMLLQVTILLGVGVLFGVRIEYLELLPVIYLLAALFGMT
ncbi:MAG: ABC transporter permease [Chloroflexia bacterium]